MSIDRDLFEKIVSGVQSDWMMGGLCGTIYEEFAYSILESYIKRTTSENENGEGDRPPHILSEKNIITLRIEDMQPIDYILESIRSNPSNDNHTLELSSPPSTAKIGDYCHAYNITDSNKDDAWIIGEIGYLDKSVLSRHGSRLYRLKIHKNGMINTTGWYEFCTKITKGQGEYLKAKSIQGEHINNVRS